MTSATQGNLKTRILDFAERRDGSPFGAADLSKLGSQAAVNQALSRMSRAGELQRAGRGAYMFVRPEPSSDTLPASMPRREQALAVAARLFAEKGFFGVSMRDIAQESGVNTATIYHHFPDKVSLYDEVVRIAWDEGARRVLLDDSDASPREQFELWISKVIDFHFANSESARIRDREMFLGNWDFIDRHHDILMLTRRNARAVEQLIEKMAPPILAEMSADRVGQMVYALVYGLIKFMPALRLVNPDQPEPDIGSIKADVIRFVTPTLGW